MGAPGRAATAPGQAGFTLLELLIAATLLAVLVAIMAGGIRFGARVWERTGAIGAAASEVRVVRDFLRHHLAEARAISDTPVPGQPATVAFTGGAERVEFVGEMPAAAAASGLVRIALAFDRGEGTLRLAWWPYRGARGEGGGDRVLLENLAGVSLSYFGKPTDDDQEGWHESWAGARHLPELVRLRIGFRDGDDRAWPELIVAVPAAGADIDLGRGAGNR